MLGKAWQPLDRSSRGELRYPAFLRELLMTQLSDTSNCFESDFLA